LQRIADGRAGEAARDPAAMRGITSRWLRENGLTGESANAVADRVQVAVENALGDEKGQWIVGGEGHSELALSGIHNDELVSVVLDRVRIDDDGSHWIIDYKTSSHEGGNLQGFLQAETERYRPQLERYANIYSNWSGIEARCALYFPLLTSFVEVNLARRS
ncbi:MAG TPA: PD-(D/E)XK nuclease family protein, partial [Woeseiaceae bacterium]|nr:PD-(D/E)XK nuclease family protein [Woeseiaceae bacterium]